MKLTSKFRIVYVNMPPLQSDYYNYILSVYFSLGLENLYNTRADAKLAIKNSGFPGKYIILEEYTLGQPMTKNLMIADLSGKKPCRL